MDMGLSKEATAELLQRRSAVHAAEQSPAFAEGYHKMKSAMHNGSIRVRPGYVVKQARGFGQIASGLGGVARGIGNLIGSAGSGVFNAAVKNPRTAKAIIGTTAVGGIGYGAGRFFGDRYDASGAPVIPGNGMYNPEQEKSEYDNELDRFSSGIADTNKAITDSADRRKVLQQSVDSNSPQSAAALKELKMLNAQVDRASSVRQQHLDALNSKGNETASKLKSITDRQQTLRARKQSPFWRGLHWATLRDPDKSYDAAIDELQSPAAELSHQDQIIKDQRERLPYYKGVRYEQPSSAQLQREFFPSR